VLAHVEVDRAVQWVETWRAAVRLASSPVALLRLPSTNIFELSIPAGAVLGRPSAELIGTAYKTLVERPHVSAWTAMLMATGAVEAVQARRRHRRADGSVVEMLVCGRAIRSERAGDMSLWVAGDAVARARWAHGESLAEIPPTRPHPGLEPRSDAVLMLDGDWHVSGLNSRVVEALDYRDSDLGGAGLTELVHRDDLTLLLLTLARATSGVRADEVVRLRHRNGTWPRIAVTVVARDDGGVPRFSLVLSGHDTCSSTGNARAIQLERHLRRIAIELERAGVIADYQPSPALFDLSTRQQEIAARLLRGERVPRIAKAMYLSQSTVRNHLAAMFRRFAVHSQEELLTHLRDSRAARR
jgi:PAS domain-containing protein/DNA-binding CsgD family transcriptional regulator